MYENSFQLSHRPFAPAPNAERYVPIASLEQSRLTLARAIERGEGPGLIVGPAGSGKSLLLQVLGQHFRGRFLVALLASSRLSTRRALLQNILFELKLPYREMDESELRLSLIDHLEPRTGGGDGLLLLVDEAHTLPLRLVEEIRLLTNLVKGGESRVRLVLAGNMALEERLASPKLDSFHQRIAARCYLQPMTRDETCHYIQEQIRRAGGLPEVLFSAEALKAVHTATDGIPRLVNQVCDHALLLAHLGGRKQLGPAGIEEAWADLQQLPVPWHEPPRVAAAEGSGIVEFGQLADDAAPRAVAGMIGPSVGDVALARLDEVERYVREIEPVPGDAEFSPASESGTEVELIFHEAHDPFGSHWDEEEVVIDRYASLEDKALRNRQRVSSSEGRKIGALVNAAVEPPPQIVPPLPLDAGFEGEPESAIATTTAFDPASDPLLPEEPTDLSARSQAAFSQRATISLRSIAEDDRDIIVVEDDQPPAAPLPSAGRPRRQEYRQLFSSLRNKT